MRTTGRSCDTARQGDPVAGGSSIDPASLRRHAALRSGAPTAYAIGFCCAAAMFLSVAPAMVVLPALLAAAAAEVIERTVLRRMVGWPSERFAGPGALLRIRLTGMANTAVVTLGLLAIWRAGGPGAAPLVAAMALCLSVYAALANVNVPCLHAARQAAMLGIVALVNVVPVAAAWPSPSATATSQAVASLMLVVMLAVIHYYKHVVNQRRGVGVAALRAARSEAEARLAQLERVRRDAETAAMHDALTGMANRRYLARHLEDIGAAAEGPAEIALLLIDLDRFKAINDTLGHAAGDAVLREVSDRLRAALTPGDFAARIGGDEFVIVLASDKARAAADQLADRVIEAARRPVPYEDQLCRLGASVGVAVTPRPEAQLDRLLSAADLALYRAKARGRSRTEHFSPALHLEMVEARRLGDDILRGLEADEFLPHHQPVVDADSGAVAAVEAMARWAHPDRGLLTPGAFLSAAAEIGALAEIDRIVMRRALADRAAWAAAGLVPPPLSVNVSAARLAEPDLAAEVAAAALPPGALVFELGEAADAAVRDERVRWTLDRLAELGVETEVDDFGAGAASAATLALLRPRRVKIDRSFVAPMLEAPARRALVASLVDLGRSLGLGVTAEGVETRAHAEALRALGCTRLQGYAFAPPMSAAAMADWLHRSRAAEGAGSDATPGADAVRATLTPPGAAYIRTART